MTFNSISRRNALRFGLAAAIGSAMSRTSLFAADDAAMAEAMKKRFSAKLEAIDLGDGLTMVMNGGGNVLVNAAADAVLVIDSGLAFRAADLMAVVDQLAPGAKRKVLFNTHWHRDHTGGNADFVAAGFAVASSENCRKRLSEKIVMEDMAVTNEPAPETARPTMTFHESMDFALAAKVHVVAMPPGHTDTDAIAIIAASGVIHTGDLHFNGVFPVIDRSTGGSLDGITADTKALIDLCDDKTRVIPGHGKLGDKASLAAQLELLQMVHDRLAPLGEKKMTLDEVLAKEPLADLDEKWGRGFVRSPLFTRMAYGQWVTKAQ